MVEKGYRNYRPFYPSSHTFGTKGKSGIVHGDELKVAADVAEQLSRRRGWQVKGNEQLDFRYLDRELLLVRSKPGPANALASELSAKLEVDLFLANAYDRTPILAETKIKHDQCPFYALIQLLTQAGYAAPSERERLVLFGSSPASSFARPRETTQAPLTCT